MDYQTMNELDTMDSTPSKLTMQEYEKARITVELNEQSVKNVELPLYMLEQRILGLESAMRAQHDYTKLAEIISKKIDDRADKYLPNIMDQVRMINAIREK